MLRISHFRPKAAPKRVFSTEAAASAAPVKGFGEMPSPKQTFLLGNIPQFAKNVGRTHELFHQWALELGPIYKFKVLGQQTVVVSDADLIAEVFRQNPMFPKRPNLRFWEMYRESRNLPKSIILNDGEDWRRVRRVTQKLLDPAVVDSYVPRIVDICKQMVHMVESSLGPDGKWTNMRDIKGKYGLEAFTAILTGTRLGLLDPNKTPSKQTLDFIDAVQTMFTTSEDLARAAPVYQYIETPTLKKHHDAWDRLLKIGKQIADNVTPDNLREKDGVPNFLDYVSQTQDLTSVEIDTLNAEMVAGGVDTTALTFSFLTYHIAKNPEAQQELYEEIERETGGGDITAESLKKMTFLRNVFIEALRVTPVVPQNSRILTEDTVLAGYNVPKGTWILTNNLTTCRSEKHFPDPIKFCPHRHARGHQGQKDAHPFSNLPFGAGARMCPGRRVATMEICLGLAYLVRNFEITYDAPFPEIRARLILSPVTENNFVTLKKRQPKAASTSA